MSQKEECEYDERAGGSLLQRQAEGVRVVQLAKENDLGRPYRTFQCLKGPYKKTGSELFTRADSDRIRRSGFKL